MAAHGGSCCQRIHHLLCTQQTRGYDKVVTVIIACAAVVRWKIVLLFHVMVPGEDGDKSYYKEPVDTANDLILYLHVIRRRQYK